MDAVHERVLGEYANLRSNKYGVTVVKSQNHQETSRELFFGDLASDGAMPERRASKKKTTSKECSPDA
ncbi:hypothetical protein O9992_28495 [Vibrio lentus]|nr:hypothetical protein [Vibrio lentus]